MQERNCTKCGLLKPHTAFVRNASKAGGVDSECRKCRRARELTPGSRALKRWRGLKVRYGITQTQYQGLYSLQGGRCAICKCREESLTPDGERRALSVDHDHTTGRIRGLLCSGCNRAIGYLKDSDQVSLNAAYYLNLHRRLQENEQTSEDPQDPPG